MRRSSHFSLTAYTCPVCGVTNRVALGICDHLKMPNQISVSNKEHLPWWHCIECHVPHAKAGFSWRRVVPGISDAIPEVIHPPPLGVPNDA